MNIDTYIVQYSINIENREIKRKKYLNPCNTDDCKVTNINIGNINNIKAELKENIEFENKLYKYKTLEKILSFNKKNFYESDIIKCLYYENNEILSIEGELRFINKNRVKIKNKVISINAIINVDTVKENYHKLIMLTKENYNEIYDNQKGKFFKIRILGSLILSVGGIIIAGIGIFSFAITTSLYLLVIIIIALIISIVAAIVVPINTKGILMIT